MTNQNRGVLFTVTSFLLWGFLPIYWKIVQTVPAKEILAHRVVWSLLFLFFIIQSKKSFSKIVTALKSSKTVALFILTTALISLNWFIYIWAVNDGHIIETSLGYFINPILNILLGVIILKERLRPAQWTSVALATVGVLYLTFNYGSFPWISLSLAFSFGLYGLLRKQASFSSTDGLFIETSFIFLPALLFLFYLNFEGKGSYVAQPIYINILLLFSGVATALPLLLFTAGAQLLPYSTVGILQYIAPTLQFLIGLFIYNENFSTERLVGFIFIWSALIFFTIDSILVQRKTRLRRLKTDQ